MHVALPALSGTLEQIAVGPSLNVTVHCVVGFGVAPAVTVAVKVTELPYALGLVPVVNATDVEVVRRAKKLFPVDELLFVKTMPASGLVPRFWKPVGTV